MRSRVCALVLAIILCAANASAITVSFVTPPESVPVNTPFTLDISIDFEGHMPSALFSYGYRIAASGPSVVDVGAIVPVAELDFNGLADGAQIDTSSEVIGIKGNIDFLEQDYTGNALGSVTLTLTATGLYTFSLAEFRTLGDDESIWLDGDGETIDAQITYDAIQITAAEIPESLPAIAISTGPDSASDIKLSFPTQLGFSYEIQHRVKLDDGQWMSLDTLPGSGLDAVYIRPGALMQDRAFYRVRVLMDD